jgi:hypothetical protein
MLMHRAAIDVGRAVAANERWASVFQGEAAGRSMAVPVNWRACDIIQREAVVKSSELAGAMMQLGANTANMRESSPAVLIITEDGAVIAPSGQPLAPAIGVSSFPRTPPQLNM